MDTKGILLWGGLILIFAIGFFLSRRMKKQIEENGIEVDAVISRITDEGAQDEIDRHYYARYRTADGEEIEAAYPGMITEMISHPGVGLILVHTGDGPIAIGKNGQRRTPWMRTTPSCSLGPRECMFALGTCTLALRAWSVHCTITTSALSLIYATSAEECFQHAASWGSCCRFCLG